MINSSYNNSASMFSTNNRNISNKMKTPVGELDKMKNNKISDKVSQNTEKTSSKVETIKSQIADGSYKLLDSTTLAKGFLESYS